MTDGGEEAREGFPREGLDPGEATLETGDLRCLEGSPGCDPGWAQEGARAGPGAEGREDWGGEKARGLGEGRGSGCG